jgi:hypothetical protein
MCEYQPESPVFERPQRVTIEERAYEAGYDDFLEQMNALPGILTRLHSLKQMYTNASLLWNVDVDEEGNEFEWSSSSIRSRNVHAGTLQNSEHHDNPESVELQDNVENVDHHKIKIELHHKIEQDELHHNQESVELDPLR